MKPEDESKRNYSVYDKPTTSKSRWRKQPTQSSTEIREHTENFSKKPEPQKIEKPKELLTNEEMNALASKILKAEIIGNQVS